MMKNILPNGVECVLVRQPELGHAILCAEPVVGDEPFAVLLADDFIKAEGAGVTADLVRAYEASGRTQISVVRVAGESGSSYGVVVPGEAGDMSQASSKNQNLRTRRRTLRVLAATC